MELCFERQPNVSLTINIKKEEYQGTKKIYTLYGRTISFIRSFTLLFYCSSSLLFFALLRSIACFYIITYSQIYFFLYILIKEYWYLFSLVTELGRRAACVSVTIVPRIHFSYHHLLISHNTPQNFQVRCLTA